MLGQMITLCYLKQKKCVIYFSFFYPYSTRHSGILHHGKHGHGLWKLSHSNYQPFPHKRINKPLTTENLDFHIDKVSLSLIRFLPVISKYICQNTCLQTHSLLPVNEGITVCSTSSIEALVSNYYIISLKTEYKVKAV